MDSSYKSFSNRAKLMVQIGSNVHRTLSFSLISMVHESTISRWPFIPFKRPEQFGYILLELCCDLVKSLKHKRTKYCVHSQSCFFLPFGEQNTCRHLKKLSIPTLPSIANCYFFPLSFYLTFIRVVYLTYHFNTCIPMLLTVSMCHSVR